MTKSFTDLEQSKKLAEILPLKSADMYYYKDCVHAIMSAYHPNIVIPSFGVRNMPNYEEGDIPCWSLAALLDVLPSVIKRKGKRIFLTLEKAGAYNLYYKSPDRLDELWETNEEPIDACVEMINKLHEQNIL